MSSRLIGWLCLWVWIALWAFFPSWGIASPPLAHPKAPSEVSTPTADGSAEKTPPFQFGGPLSAAKMAFRQGKFQNAKGLAEKLRAATKDLKQRDALEAFIGTCFYAQGEIAGAVQQLEAFVKQNPSAVESRVALGEGYHLLGLREKEREIWNGIFDDHDAEKLDMKDCRVVRLLGQAAHRLGSYQDAAEQLKQAAALAKESKNREEQVLALLSLSALRIEKYEIGYAELSVQDALRRDPENPDGKARLAQIKLEQGNDVSSASELLEEALSVNPHHSHAIELKAQVLIDNEQYEDALALLVPQLARNGHDLRIRALKAAALWLLDRKGEFEREREETLRRSPLFTEFHRIVAQRQHVQHRYEAQIAVLEEAVKMNPKDYYALGDLAQAYLQTGDEQRSYETLNKAWKGDRYNRRTYNLLDLFEKHLQKNYKMITLDIDPRQPKKGGLKVRIHKTEEEVFLPILEPFVQSLYVEFSRRYRFSPKLPIVLEFYKEPDNFSVRTFGLPSVDPGLLGVTFSRVITARAPSQRKIPWGLMVWHELGHVFAIELSKGRVPRWFTEGLSEWETMQLYPGWSRRTHAEVAAALRDGKLLSMGDLNVGFTRARSQSHVVVAYHQAALSVEFLAARFGFPKIVEALNLFGAGMRTKEVLEKITGLSQDKLDEEFRKHLRKRLSAYEGTFYVRPSDYADLDGLKQQLRKTPKDARLHGLLAVGKGRMGADPAEVAESIALAKQLDPRCKEAILAEGELQQKLGKKAEAEKLFRELISVGGDGYDVRYRLGTLYADQKQTAAAIAEFERAKTLDPDRGEPHVRLAALYKQEQKMDEALAELGAATLLDISDDETLIALVEQHAEKKHAKDVLLYADRLLYVSPYVSRARRNAAEAWLQLGQTKRALAEAQAAQKLLPDAEDVDEEALPKYKAEKRRLEELLQRISQSPKKPFSGPETLLDIARKRSGLLSVF